MYLNSPVFVLFHSPEKCYHPSLSMKMHVALMRDEIINKKKWQKKNIRDMFLNLTVTVLPDKCYLDYKKKSGGCTLIYTALFTTLFTAHFSLDSALYCELHYPMHYAIYTEMLAFCVLHYVLFSLSFTVYCIFLLFVLLFAVLWALLCTVLKVVQHTLLFVVLCVLLILLLYFTVCCTLWDHPYILEGCLTPTPPIVINCHFLAYPPPL